MTGFDPRISGVRSDLATTTAQLPSLFPQRFYTSSLLVTYDGASQFSSTIETSDELVDVRIIDFAHSTHRGLKDSTLHDGPDRGFICGIQNFVKILDRLKHRGPGNDSYSSDEEAESRDIEEK